MAVQGLLAFQKHLDMNIALSHGHSIARRIEVLVVIGEDLCELCRVNHVSLPSWPNRLLTRISRASYYNRNPRRCKDACRERKGPHPTKELPDNRTNRKVYTKIIYKENSAMISVTNPQWLRVVVIICV